MSAPNCIGTETAWNSLSPWRQTVADSSPSRGFITTGSFERSCPWAPGRSLRAMTIPDGSVATKKSAPRSLPRSCSMS